MTSISTTEIDVVLADLDRIVASARLAGDRLGLFAAMYGQTTRAVRDQIAAGGFDDAERMCRFVRAFAGRYTGPLAGFRAALPVSRSWRTAFEAGGRSDCIVLQHLLLGINAHVNLDLAVVAAEICPGADIDSLHDDFMRVNAILAALLPRMRAAIGQFSPLLDVLDRIGGGEDDEVLTFSIRVARDEAWRSAVVLASVDGEAGRAALIDSLDRRVAVLSRLVADPGGLLGRAVDVVAATESDDMVAVIDALGRVTLESP